MLQKVDCRLGAPAREHDKLCREGGVRTGREEKERGSGKEEGRPTTTKFARSTKVP